MSSGVASVEEIDQALADWRDRLARIDDNLMALEQQPTLRLLDGATLEGETEKRVSPALVTMRELFQQRGLLNDALTQTQRLRGRDPRRKPSPEALQQIQKILSGASITLPPLQTPIGERDLLTPSERHIRPEDLLAAMTQAYETARDAVMAVDAAWTQLAGLLDHSAEEILALDSLAKSLGEDAGSELSAVSAELESLRGWVARDPLGAQGGLDSRLAPLLMRLRSRLEALRLQRQQMLDDQARAHSLLAELRGTHSSAQDAAARCEREIVWTAPPPRLLPEGAIEGLASWLTSVDAVAAAGRWSSAQVGLARWLQAANQQLGAERQALSAVVGPLSLRDALSGRIGARLAQLRAMRLRGQTLDPAVDARGRELEETLQQVPVAIDAVHRSLRHSRQNWRR